MMGYANNRENFNKVAQDYRNYLKLYAFFNNGSYDGATTFDVFYQNHTYYAKYSEEALKDQYKHE